MVNPGNHRARATQAALGTSSTGNDQVAVQFEILDWETGTPNGEKITWYGSFTDKAFPITVRALRNMGWTGDDLSDLSTVSANEVVLDVAQEEYDGKLQTKVKWVNAIEDNSGPVLKAPMSEDKAKAFAAKMKGKVLAFNQSEGKPRNTGSTLPVVKKTPPIHRGPAATPADAPDDIPF